MRNIGHSFIGRMASTKYIEDIFFIFSSIKKYTKHPFYRIRNKQLVYVGTCVVMQIGNYDIDDRNQKDVV